LPGGLKIRGPETVVGVQVSLRSLDSKRADTSGPQSTTGRNGLASSSPRFPLVNSADFDEVLLNDAASALNPQPRSSFYPQVFQDADVTHPLDSILLNLQGY
jgi:hypothetical protein